MWCQHCQQDVPAIAHSVGGEVVCVRCQQGFETPPSLRMFEFESSDDSENGADNTSQDPVENLTDWQTDCKFRHLAQTLRNTDSHSASRYQGLSTTYTHHNPPQDLVSETDPWDPSGALADYDQTTPTNHRGNGWAGQIMAWLLVFFGVVALASGAILTSWSLLEDLPLYWDVGVTLAFAGQGLLILGLVLVLLFLWQNSRSATSKLQEVHWQLSSVQRTAQTIVGLRNGNAPAFYAELARGASPATLLANLQGQVDQLNVKLKRNA